MQLRWMARWLDEVRVCRRFLSLQLRDRFLFTFLFAAGALSLQFGDRRRRRRNRHSVGVHSRHAHHRIGHSIGFLLLRISRLAHRQLRLELKKQEAAALHRH
jgi:hypothetical protein